MYRYGGKVPYLSRYVPFGEREAAAKFAYFRKAEEKINGGPAPIKTEPGACGTNSGYMKHFRLNEERCDACKAAHTQVELKRQRASRRALEIHSKPTDIADE